MEVTDRFGQLISEVSHWSYINFGAKESKWVPGIRLGALASALGIIEELGELGEALTIQNVTRQHDAIADVMIFMSDFIYRSNLSVCIIEWKRIPTYIQFHSKTKLGEQQIRSQIETGSRVIHHQLAICSGNFAHCILKSHQGIRNFGDKALREQHIGRALTEIIITLGIATTFQHDRALSGIFDLTEKVWQEVKQRNWRSNPNSQS